MARPYTSSDVEIAPGAAPADMGNDLASAQERPSHIRRNVLWLTVAVYMITYMDRVVIATAAPSIQKEFNFSLQTMGWIFSAFQIGYAVCQIPGGWLGDRFGARRALSGVVVWWSIFTAATATMWSAGSMFVCRLLFGMGEAGSFPIATRSLSRWMLPAERGWALGVTHAGARLGGAFTPMLVAFLIALLGWRTPFFIFAGVGLAWAALWYWYYRDSPAEHPSVNTAERALISASLGKPAALSGAVIWRCLLQTPQIWLLSIAYFCYAYSLAIFLTWFPKYLMDARGLNLAQMGIFASLPLMAGVIGDVGGGWISDRWLKHSGNLKLARRLVACVGFALAGVMIPIATLSQDSMVSVACFSAAVFGLELTVGVSWAVTLDVGGDCAGSVSAAMNTFGNTGGAIAAALTAYLVAHSGWSLAFFVPSGLSLLAAVLFLRIDASRRISFERAPTV
jgi:MFS transporter, ACS family, glucarate transporter